MAELVARHRRFWNESLNRMDVFLRLQNKTEEEKNMTRLGVEKEAKAESSEKMEDLLK